MKNIDLIIDALKNCSAFQPKKYYEIDKALAAARELRELKWREAFICGRCDGVYADMCVSECDCEVGVEPIFKRGFICYAPDEAKHD